MYFSCQYCGLFPHIKRNPNVRTDTLWIVVHPKVKKPYPIKSFLSRRLANEMLH